MAQLKVPSFASDDAVGKIRRLSVVLDTSVKEMEKDFKSPDAVNQFTLAMDYRNILVQLNAQKALQDDRRQRLR